MSYFLSSEYLSPSLVRFARIPLSAKRYSDDATCPHRVFAAEEVGQRLTLSNQGMASYVASRGPQLREIFYELFYEGLSF